MPGRRQLTPVLPPWPPTSLSAVGKVQIKELERRLMWPLWLTWNWSLCFNVICLCSMARRPPVANKLWATEGRHAAVYSWPFRWHQKTVLEITITVLYRFEQKARWPTFIGDFVQLLLWIQSVPVSNADVKHAFVHHTVRPHVIAWPRNVTSVGVRSPLLGLLSLVSYLFPYILKTGYQFETGKPA